LPLVVLTPRETVLLLYAGVVCRHARLPKFLLLVRVRLFAGPPFDQEI
jgi:hypothetical protein